MRDLEKHKKSRRRWVENNRERHNEYHKQYRKKHSEKRKEIAYRANMKTRYGLSFEDYSKMFEEQDGKCGCCGDDEKLFVDHCHESGKIRGLICRFCNTGLGFAKDDIRRLELMIKYLKDRGYVDNGRG